MKKFLVSFIPEKYKAVEEDFRKAKLFVNLCFITPLFSLFYVFTSYACEMNTVYKAMLFNVVGFFVLPFIFKKNYFSFKFLGNVYVAIGAIGVLVTVLYTGGLISSILPWLAILPLTSLLLTDKKSGWIWTIWTYLMISTIGFLTLKSYQFVDETSASFLTLFNTANLTGLGVFIFLIALVFENTKNTALKNLDDRNEQLAIEKKRSDDLLLNILPSEIVMELKETGKSKAKLFDHVSVIFTDFVNFTKISENLSPDELVSEIDYCFKGIDEIIEKNGLEKIKTIGDAYLAVCGLPNEDNQHAHKTILAGMEILQFIENRKKNGGKFEIRIGVHSGSLVAGIVGVKKFAYDIWGDTVNTASRMESSGEQGKLNISSSTYELVKDAYVCEYRGKIEAKNKGNIDMYFVTAAK